MARLIDKFQEQVSARAERNVPSHVRSAMERFGWTSKDVAQKFDVSERTARRWRQQDRVPEKRAAEWHREAQSAAEKKQWDRMSRRGISSMKVEGTYKISKERYKSNAWSPVRIMPGNKIRPAQIRGVREALEQGDEQGADELLNEALAEAYDAPGLSFEDVDSLDFDI